MPLAGAQARPGPYRQGRASDAGPRTGRSAADDLLVGIGRLITFDASILRFLVMAAAFAVTLALGYFRFVRRTALMPAPPATGFAEGEGLAVLEQRIRELERRMDDAAAALGSRNNH